MNASLKARLLKLESQIIQIDKLCVIISAIQQTAPNTAVIHPDDTKL